MSSHPCCGGGGWEEGQRATSIDIISLVLVMEVVWRRDRRGDGEC